MPAKVANIAKNTSYFTLSLVIQKVISFTYFIILARVLGPEDLGKYYFAISFTSIFSIIIDLGFTNVLTRETAKSQGRAQEYLSTVLGLKIPLAVIAIAVIGAIVWLKGYPELTRMLIIISTICVVLDSFTYTFFSTIRGFHNLSYESVSSIIFQVIVLLSGLAIIRTGGGIGYLMWSLAIASSFNFCYSLILLVRKYRIKAFPDFRYSSLKAMVMLSGAFTLYAVFSRVYGYIDSVLLYELAGDTAVGIYQIPFKIINALQFLPMAFTASLYPAFSLYWVSNRGQLGVTFERAMTYLIIISLPISIGTIAAADKIILLFSSGFSDAILPLKISIAAVFFIFLGYPIGSLLNACDRQKALTINMFAVLLLSIVLNVLLIPRYGVTGASVTRF